MGSFSENNKTTKCIEEEKCLDRLQLILDGEGSCQEEERFLNHIDECMPCYNLYKVDKAVKDLLRSKVEKKKVPGNLVQKIKKKIFLKNQSAS